MNEPQQPTRRPQQWLIPFVIPFIVVLVADLWSKAAVFAYTNTHEIDGRLYIESSIEFTWWIVPAWNTGVAWSLFADSPLFIALLTALLIPALIVAYWKWYRNHHTFVDIAFGAVLGGAIANAYDRFMTHLSDTMFGVRDFLAFTIPVIDYDWPTFNIADAGICTGFVMLLIASFVQERRAAQLKSSQPTEGSDDSNPQNHASTNT